MRKASVCGSLFCRQRLLTNPRARKKASHIVLACRDTAKGQKAKEAIIRDTGCKPQTTISVWTLDLANYTSVLSFGERVRSELPRLDAFVANAGMELQEYRTAEDLEIHLTVNVVSTFLCTTAILPKLQQTARDYNVSTTATTCGSMYHIFGPDAEFDAGLSEDVDMFDALSTPDPAKTDIVWRYALSKLMVHQCFHGLVATVAETNKYPDVVINLINPGWCATGLSRAKSSNMGERACFALIGWTAEKGSRPYIHAMTEGRKSNGKYLSECQVRRESQYVRSARGKQIEKKMWSDLMRRFGRISPQVASFLR